jgi:hypothetical protein
MTLAATPSCTFLSFCFDKVWQLRTGKLKIEAFCVFCKEWTALLSSEGHTHYVPRQDKKDEMQILFNLQVL